MSAIATLPIITDISGRKVSRDEILRYEDQRIAAAAKKLGVGAPARGDLSERREAFLRTKLELGTDEILRRLKRDTAIAGVIGETTARLTARRRCSVVDIYSPAGSSAQFIDFYWHSVHTNDEAGLLRAHPDHFVQRIGGDGRHEVVETTGGSPVAAHFYIDYGDVSGLVTPAGSAFPGQIVGVARDGGMVIGGVRHQLRDTADGFHARLTIEFPLLTAGPMIAGHRWHLAVEFSNWIEAAVTAV